MKILLKNGTVYDGRGNAPKVLDVLLEDDCIAEVGNIDVNCADQVLDMTGLCVAPGLIDSHSHNDYFYDYDDADVYYKPFLEQGITTQITGNCGFSPFGIDENSPFTEKMKEGLFKAKNPGSFADFVKRAQGKLFVNMVPLIGHGTARIGASGIDPKPLTDEQIKIVTDAAEEAMQNGAFGGSFGFMYEPGMYSKENELIAFASAIAKYDGIVTVHPRACSKVAMAYPLISAKPHIEMALDEVIGIMEKSGCRMEYSHLIFVGKSSWGSADRMLSKFYQYREAGYDIGYDMYSMTYGASVITVICPDWYMAMDEETKKKPFSRFKLRLIINITRKLLGIDYKDITIAYINDDPKYRKYEGRTVADVAREENKDCLDLYLELIDASDGAGKVYLDKYYNEELIRKLMEDELSIFMTDAWVETKGVQNGAAFQCYPNFLLKAKKYGIPMEKVIHKMTGAVVERYGIHDRGILEAGYKADITVFDPEGLKVYPDEPGRKPDGIRYVFVNGKCAVDENGFRAERAGELILKKKS